VSLAGAKRTWETRAKQAKLIAKKADAAAAQASPRARILRRRSNPVS
jgi:hypothetical protein